MFCNGQASTSFFFSFYVTTVLPDDTRNNRPKHAVNAVIRHQSTALIDPFALFVIRL